VGQTFKRGRDSGQITIILCLTHHKVCSTDMTYTCGCLSVHQYAWLPLVLGDTKNIQSQYTILTAVYCDILWYIGNLHIAILIIAILKIMQYNNCTSTLLWYCDNIELLPSPSYHPTVNVLLHTLPSLTADCATWKPQFDQTVLPIQESGWRDYEVSTCYTP